MKKNILLLSASVLLLSFSACRKYEEGPGISLLSKKMRVENSWYIEKYTVNNIDSTSRYAQYVSGEFYDKEGNFRTFADIHYNSIPLQITGKWEFQNNRREIKRTLADGTVEILEIIRLKERSMWYRMKRGNDVLEFHLTNDQRNLPQ